jgi:endo-1,4-beta-xylanase
LKHHLNILRAAAIIAAVAPALAQKPVAAARNPQREQRLHDSDTTWRDAAAQRIEQHRKADLRVSVRDAQGRPIPDATVNVTMKRHRFGFGALIGASRWENRPTAADAARHLALVEERFNKAVTIVKPDDRAADLALDWLVERNIRVRGHYLMWGPVQPERGRHGQPAEAFGLPVKDLLEQADDAQRERIRNAAFAYIERVLAFAGKRVTEWDAINHIANDNHVSYSSLFGTRIYAEVIKRARELAPHAEMWVNEGNVLTAGNRLQKYHDVIAELIALGAKPDGIGFMAHFREGEFTPPEEIYRRLETFAALVPNLQLTELDIDTANEQLQADHMRDVVTIAFSHPAVSAIVMWQVWGQGAGNKALWRPDWSIKPAGQVWLDHVFKAWWTVETGRTDREGAFTTRGFLGDYEISIRRGEKTKTVQGELAPGGAAFPVTF